MDHSQTSSVPALSSLTTAPPTPDLEGLNYPVEESIENEGSRMASAQRREFSPALTIGVFASRWLQTYATPCHSRGASL